MHNIYDLELSGEHLCPFGYLFVHAEGFPWLFFLDIRGVFQNYAERFHRMFAIAARLMIFHVKHAWYIVNQL